MSMKIKKKNSVSIYPELDNIAVCPTTDFSFQFTPDQKCIIEVFIAE